MERQSSKHGSGINFERKSSKKNFSSFDLFCELDTWDADMTKNLEPAFLRERSRVVEIVGTQGLIFTLTSCGLCVAFDIEKKARICLLNITSGEVVRSLFFNKANNHLITVSVYREDKFSSLKCRTTHLDSIRRGQPEHGVPLFATESLHWPGFVEFDDVNQKILTFSATNRVFKIWDMINYRPLYALNDPNISEIKISPGIMLLIYNRQSSSIPLRILSIEDGTVLKSFTHMLHRGKGVDFIEQFNEKLLIKQQDENLRIVDVQDGTVVEVDKSVFPTPSAFIFLYENQLFLTFKHHLVQVWNFKGHLVSSFEDHRLWYSGPSTCSNTSNIAINSKQDTIISYCLDGDNASGGAINVSSILSGKLLARIKPKAKSNGVDAVHGITALFYDEERNEIYTGNRSGVVHVWNC